jgi:hypothetical protein
MLSWEIKHLPRIPFLSTTTTATILLQRFEICFKFHPFLPYYPPFHLVLILISLFGNKYIVVKKNVLKKLRGTSPPSAQGLTAKRLENSWTHIKQEVGVRSITFGGFYVVVTQLPRRNYQCEFIKHSDQWTEIPGFPLQLHLPCPHTTTTADVLQRNRPVFGWNSARTCDNYSPPDLIVGVVMLSSSFLNMKFSLKPVL